MLSLISTIVTERKMKNPFLYIVYINIAQTHRKITESFKKCQEWDEHRGFEPRNGSRYAFMRIFGIRLNVALFHVLCWAMFFIVENSLENHDRTLNQNSIVLILKKSTRNRNYILGIWHPNFTILICASYSQL